MSDVAKVAGVSHQTVSRVLNDHPSVRAETRARVLAAIDELGYRRNSAARALVTRKSATIGVVTTGSALFGPTSMLNALEVAAREAGYFVSLATSNRFDAGAMRGTIDHLLGQGVEGIVGIAATDDAAQAIPAIRAPIAIVMVSAADTPNSELRRTVRVDQELGARLATRHLLDLGHREVVHLTGPQDWVEGRKRLEGWRRECAAAGIVDPQSIAGDWTAERGYEVGHQMAREGAPSAVFAANDELALGLLRAFWEAGLRVPEDVSVVGFDDVPSAANFIPPLTTVRQEFASLGRLAIDALLSLLNGENRTWDPIIPTLQVRGSATSPRSSTQT